MLALYLLVPTTYVPLWRTLAKWQLQDVVNTEQNATGIYKKPFFLNWSEAFE